MADPNDPATVMGNSTPPPSTERREALAWLIRLQDASAADWDAFTQWLASDPARAAAYRDVAQADADVAEGLSRPRPEPRPSGASKVVMPFQRRRRWSPVFAGGALAASVTLAVGGYWLTRQSDAPYAIETPAGVMRIVALKDGSELHLNGGTRLTLDHNDPRVVRIVHGEVRFRVIHDGAHPFVIQVGDASVRDLGTVFDVALDRSGTRIAVAQGAVRYVQGSTTQDLSAGDAVTRGADGVLRLARVDPADVAAWTSGRLVYDRVPLDRIAEDLSRATGLRVAADPAVARRTFSGGFRLGERDAATVGRAAEVMGVRARADGNGWLLVASAR